MNPVVIHTQTLAIPVLKWKYWLNILRYIDYTLDYCDATDNYPGAGKFRWTCEISWAVSEYLKCRPAGTDCTCRNKRVKRGVIGTCYDVS